MHRNHCFLGALAAVVSTAIMPGSQTLSAQGATASGKATTASKPTAKKPAAPSCATPDTTAVWYKRQRKMLDETGLTWTNDSMRVALLTATGLTVDAALAPSLGWQIFDVPPTVTPAESTMVAQLRRRGGRGGRGRGGAPGGASAATAGAAGAGATAVGATAAGVTGGTNAGAATTGGAQGATGAGRGGAAATPWPLKSAVGIAGVRAVFHLLELDSALEESGMHQMMEPGPDESVAVDIAIINDRERLLVGRKQIDGTQLHHVNGKLVPLPSEDSAHVDLRRADAGLPPLKWSVCNANLKS